MKRRHSVSSGRQLVTPYGLGTDLDIVRDPVYGYIDFSRDVEKPVIDSKFVQRLRRLRQTQTTYLVYPGADHTRFQHSLGVMHLAGLMTSSALTDYLEWGKDHIELDPALVVQVARFAALLHDIGHGPGSHAFDETILQRFGSDYPQFRIHNHENVGEQMILHSPLTKTLRTVEQLFPPKILKKMRSLHEDLPRDLPSLICAFLNPSYQVQKRMPVFSALTRVFRGHVSVDILDYVRRDSYYCGTLEYGAVDYQRLARTTLMGYEDDGTLLLATSSRSRETFRTFLFQRFQMYNNVYYHRTVRKASQMVRNLFNLAYEALEFGELLATVFASEDNWEPYLMLDDSSFVNMLGTVSSLRSYDLLWSGTGKPRESDAMPSRTGVADSKRARMIELKEKLESRRLEYKLLLECEFSFEKPMHMQLMIPDHSQSLVMLNFAIDESFSVLVPKIKAALCKSLTGFVQDPNSHVHQKAEYDNSFILDRTNIWAVPFDPDLGYLKLGYVDSDRRVHIEHADEQNIVYPTLHRLKLTVFMRDSLAEVFDKDSLKLFKDALAKSIVEECQNPTTASQVNM